MRLISGFHAIEEELRSFEKDVSKNELKKHYRILFHKPGPRIKKILEVAKKADISILEVEEKQLNQMVSSLPPTAQEHRGILLSIDNQQPETNLRFDDYLKIFNKAESSLVVVLDSITDPHNVGAIIRSADQFGVDLVILPENRSASDLGTISRTSAGASSWVHCVFVSNLVRAVDSLKDAGFWVYGADAQGAASPAVSFDKKTVLIMGSEGSGIARLLKEKCDTIVSIPTDGKLDSLNVSVAAGILLYEIRRSKLQPSK